MEFLDGDTEVVAKLLHLERSCNCEFVELRVEMKLNFKLNQV